MNVTELVRPTLMRWLASGTRQSLMRFGHEAVRRARFQPVRLIYFHRSDDPYCQLMVQALPELAERFDVTVEPRVIERLPAAMYPDPARYEALSILDAARMARLYGIGFPVTAMVPDRLSVSMANRYLASRQDDPAFFSIAEEIGAKLWRRDGAAIRSICGPADMDGAALRANEKLLGRLGHYASATVYCGGEFYPGLERLDHLERRLNAMDLGDGEVHFELHRLWRHGLQRMDRLIAGRTIDLFFSVRSPYSYLALSLMRDLMRATAVQIRLKPVLPMVMRGLPVPPMKGRYILFDAGREARLENLPFGHIADPVGRATERAMAVGMALGQGGQDFDFFHAFMRQVWTEGREGASDAGLARALEMAGISRAAIVRALPDDVWRVRAHENLQDMMRRGSWGVPTLSAGGETLWGQDRIWAALDALQQPPVTH